MQQERQEESATFLPSIAAVGKVALGLFAIGTIVSTGFAVYNYMSVEEDEDEEKAEE